MKREATFCDCPQCDKVADAECCVCEIDLCGAHTARYTLACKASVTTASTSAGIGHHVFSCVLCPACFELCTSQVNAQFAEIAIMPQLTAMFEAWPAAFKQCFTREALAREKDTL